MPKAIPPEIRRKIIEFDPLAPGATSIDQFCRHLKISRRSFYTIRKRYEHESLAALHPHSSAPHNPRRTYHDPVTVTLLAIRKRLKQQGWDYGPISVRFDGIASGDLVDPVPSVSTIARLLRQAGAVEGNPKKRPKTSLVRFQRGHAMHLWQLDGLQYTLHDPGATTVTIYQLLDDASRLDVGTCVYADHENAVDAMNAVKNAITTYGPPHELLSDNSSAFNQSRQGLVGPLESYLASVGCLSITGSPGHPQTQGNNERSHQTLIRFLDAHRPDTRQRCAELIDHYRDYDNDRRPHQGLPGHVTPAAAWLMLPHAAPREPIAYEVLVERAKTYRDRRIAATETSPMFRGDETPAPRKSGARKATPEPGATIDDLRQPDRVTVTRENQLVFYQGMRIAVPRSMRDRIFYRLVTADELAYYDAIDGELVLSIPLPVVAIAATKKFINSCNIKGVWLKDPSAHWQRRRDKAHERFAALDPSELLITGQ